MSNKSNTKSVLVTSIEFVQPLFSGNGIMTQSVVRGLLSLDYHVTVLCARPASHKDEKVVIESNDNVNDMDQHQYLHQQQQQRMDDNPNLTVLVIDVPSSTWKKLDRYSCYEHLAEGALHAFQQKKKEEDPDHPSVVDDNHDHCPTSFSFDYVFAIDWSTIPTIDKLKEHNIITTSSTTTFVFLVFRVFSSSKELCSTNDDYTFYTTREIDAIEKADITFVLSHVDQKSLQKIQQLSSSTMSSSSSLSTSLSAKPLYVHVPPLRNDFYLKCQSLQSNHYLTTRAIQQEKKKYILCNVRLSPEKNALLFAKMMKRLSDQKVLSSLNLTPIMIGSICDETYAKEVYDTLPPETIIVNKFLNSDELITILTKTALMIHPPLYDAFGMTIAEGAAIGVPCLIHHENIGASSLFRSEKDEIIEEDLTSPTLLHKIQCHLASYDKLNKISQNAKLRALSWTVKEYAEGLRSFLDSDEDKN